MRTVGIVLLATGGAFGFVLYFAQDAPLVLGLIPPILIITGGFTFYRGRQQAARKGAAGAMDTPGPKVLYLRSFDSDPSVVRQTFKPLLTAELMSGLASEEELLAEVLRPFGRLVAIGRPGERLPAPGAARVYVDDSSWQAVVNEQMLEAQLVIIRIGSSAGLMWELCRAREVVNPRRLLLVVLKLPKRQVAAAVADAGQALGVPLPLPSGNSALGRPEGIYRFSSTWQPEFLAIRPPVMRRSVYKRLRSGFAFALRPVFEDFGIPWIRPGLSKLTISSLVAVGVVLVAPLLLIAVSLVV